MTEYRVPPAAVLAELRTQLSVPMKTIWSPLGATRPAFDGLTKELRLFSPPDVRAISPDVVEGTDMGFIYDVAQRNTDVEPAQTDPTSDDVIALMGTSPFVAAKTLNMPQVIATVLGDAPLGVLFGVPHRGLVFVQRVGKSTVNAMSWLPTIIVLQSRQEPDRALSQHTYYWNDGVTQRITSLGPGGVTIAGDGALAEALRRA